MDKSQQAKKIVYDGKKNEKKQKIKKGVKKFSIFLSFFFRKKCFIPTKL